MGLMEKKRKQRRVLLRHSAGSKTVRGRTSCHWCEKSRGSGRRSNRRSLRARPLSCILANGHIPHASMRTRCKVSQQLGAIKKRVSIARNCKISYTALQDIWYTNNLEHMDPRAVPLVDIVRHLWRYENKGVLLLTLPPSSANDALRTTRPNQPVAVGYTDQGNILDDLHEKWLELEIAKLDERDQSATLFNQRLNLLMLGAEREACYSNDTGLH